MLVKSEDEMMSLAEAQANSIVLVTSVESIH